jgi:hypothetical protein
MVLRFFIRRVLAGACCAAVLPLILSPVMAQDRLILEIDRAKIIELPSGTNTLVIGNPGIADATLLRRQNRIILTARSYGETNMIALDSRGEALAEVMVVVKNSGQGLIVQRGLERETWTCNPRCEPAVSLGDSTRHAGDAINSANQYGAFARSLTTGAK